jgi:N6-adenosine-specific RNA methylase IME4
MAAAMNELSTIRFYDSALAIAEAFPRFQDRLKYKLMLDVAKVIGERTPERTRSHIEAQAALAASVDAAIETGEVTASRNDKGQPVYQVGKQGLAGAEVDRWRKLAAIPDEEREAYYASFEKWSRDALLKWWKSREVEGTTVENVASECDCILTDDLSTLAGQKFGTIYADPPWAYGNQGTRAATGNHYGTMSISEICELPVKELTADAAHLHLWTTNSFLRESFELIDAWGFEYKSCAVWVKPQMGIGNYVRVSHEFLMIAVKGDCKSFKKKNVMSWFEHGRTKHSAKPDYWRKVIEENSPTPRLELFGREQVPNWTVFGNQINGQSRFT